MFKNLLCFDRESYHSLVQFSKMNCGQPLGIFDRAKSHCCQKLQALYEFLTPQFLYGPN